MMKVRWEIDVTAETMEEAALKCLGIMRDPDSIATSFEVRLNEHTRFFTVDLEEYAVCDNCKSMIHLGEQTFRFAEIKDLFTRIEPGGMVPSCECPKCGCLMYPATKMVDR
jgi:hypothetical protein